MKPEETVEDLLNDLAKRKGFDEILTSLDAETRNLIRAKWKEILDEEQQETPHNAETFLDQKYDHVLVFHEQEMKLSQLARIDDYSTGQRICINRNLHNGRTKHIRIQAKVKDGDTIYIAGDETQ